MARIVVDGKRDERCSVLTERHVASTLANQVSAGLLLVQGMQAVYRRPPFIGPTRCASHRITELLAE